MTGKEFKQFNVSQLINETSPPPSRNDDESDEVADEPMDDSYEVYDVKRYFDLIQAMLLGKLGNFPSVHSLLRTCLDFSLTHSLQMKGRQRRELALENLSVHETFHKGKRHHVIIIGSADVKPSSNRVYGFLRHVKPELCLQFGLALYLFARFHVPDGEGMMDLSSQIFSDPNFRKTKLMNGGQKYRALSYSQQYKAWSKVLKGMGDLTPSTLSRIIASEHNNNPALGLVGPRKFMHASLTLPVSYENLELICQQAGFESASAYHLPRADMEPPSEVVLQIFPFIDYTGAIQNPFFELLSVLRVSLVQDMVEMKAAYPKDFILSHPIFESRAFYDYFRVVRKESFIPPIAGVGTWLPRPQGLGPPLHTSSIERETITPRAHFGPEPDHIQEVIREVINPINSRLERLETMIEHIWLTIAALETKVSSLSSGEKAGS